VTVLFTPVTFGGYSPELKKMVDRFVQLASPFFQMDHGEVHHPPRYAHMPRFMVVGVQRQPDPQEAHIFRTLAGRNAINMHPASYAVEVVLASDGPEALRRRFESLLTQVRRTAFRRCGRLANAGAGLPGTAVEPAGARRALLIVGSPKTKEPSTSGVLGGYLLDRLKERGWETESLTLRASLNRPEGQADLLSAVERAGLILLVFPLYVDALPYLVTKALAVMAAHRRAVGERSPQRVVAIVTAAFPRRTRIRWRWLSAASSPPKAASRGPVVLPWAEESHRWPASHRAKTLGSARQASDSSLGHDRRRAGRGTPGTRRGGTHDREQRHSLRSLAFGFTHGSVAGASKDSPLRMGSARKRCLPSLCGVGAPEISSLRSRRCPRQSTSANWVW